MNKLIILLIMVLPPLTLISCLKESSDEIQDRKQEEMNKQAVNQVGMPSINNFAEKRHLKDILELRDKEVATVTYVRDMNGKLHKVCDSIGYGIPYSTQYTNPQKHDSVHGGVTPQADPNGLYSAPSSDATWVLCLDPKSRKIDPVYVEDRITVSPFELE